MQFKFPQMHLQTRELTEEDIPLIADYWLISPDEHLISMGVDLDKLPSRAGFTQMLQSQLALPVEKRQSYALIWEVDGESIGHTNVNQIEFGVEAHMHLHIWKVEFRRKGIGAELVRQALPLFFERLQLQKLICEPYAENPGPNRTLEKVGFSFVKKHRTIPGSINFEQEVNRWELTREACEVLGLL